MLQLRVEHELNDAWKLNVGAQYLNGNLHGYAVEANGPRSSTRCKEVQWYLQVTNFLGGRFFRQREGKGGASENVSDGNFRGYARC